MPTPRSNRRSARVKSYHHGDLRAALIDAGSSLLTDLGHWEFSMREVARQATVSHNAPYFHFADKAQLLCAIAARGFVMLRARMLQALAGRGNAVEGLNAIGLAYIDFGTKNPVLYRLMFGPTLANSTGERCAGLHEAYLASKGVLSDLILGGARSGEFKVSVAADGELEAAVLAAWSVVHGMTLLFIDGLMSVPASLSLQQFAQQVGNTLLNGLVQATPSRRPKKHEGLTALDRSSR